MIRVYAAEWTLTEEPSEDLEARIHAAGYQVYWHDSGPVTVEVDTQLDDPHLSLLEELLPISSPGSWVLWWTDGDLAENDKVMVSVAVDDRLLTLRVDRPPDSHRHASRAHVGDGTGVDERETGHPPNAGSEPKMLDIRSNRELDRAITAGIEGLGDRRLIDELLAQGQTVVYLAGSEIVREHPDGTREVIAHDEEAPG